MGPNTQCIVCTLCKELRPLLQHQVAINNTADTKEEHPDDLYWDSKFLEILRIFIYYLLKFGLSRARSRAVADGQRKAVGRTENFLYMRNRKQQVHSSTCLRASERQLKERRVCTSSTLKVPQNSVHTGLQFPPQASDHREKKFSSFPEELCARLVLFTHTVKCFNCRHVCAV